MFLVRKYHFYKRALQILLGLNVFFVFWGMVAGYDYLKNHDVSSQSLMFVGFGTLIFGILLPYFLIHQLNESIRKMRLETEKAIATWVAGWLENYQRYEEDGLKDPYFWLNIFLLSMEVFGDRSNHPVAQLVTEFAPIIRHEVHKKTAQNHSSRKVRKTP